LNRVGNRTQQQLNGVNMEEAVPECLYRIPLELTVALVRHYF